MKKVLRIWLLCLLLVSSWAMSAQTSVPITSQIGSESSLHLSGCNVLASDWNYSISETYIMPREIQGGAQSLTSLSLYYASAEPLTSKTNCTISLKHTSGTQYRFIDQNDIVSNEGAVVVYTGSINCQMGWNEIPFQTPFEYDGTSYLLLIIEDNSGTSRADLNPYFVIDYCAWGTWWARENSSLSWYSNDDNPEFGDLNNFRGIKHVDNRRGVIRLHGTATPQNLPYVDYFDDQSADILAHPYGWQVPDPSNYFSNLSSCGFCGSFAVNSAYSNPNCLSIEHAQNSTASHGEVYTPWFVTPVGADSVRVSFMMANDSYGQDADGQRFFSSLAVFFQTTSMAEEGSHYGDMFYSNGNNLWNITRHYHSDWVQVSAAFPVKDLMISDGVFRLVFGVIENTSSSHTSVLIDDLTVEPIYSNTLVGSLSGEEAVYSTHYIPVNNYYRYSVSQTVVKAEELQRRPQYLTSIRFYYLGPTPMTVKTNCAISLQPTYYTNYNDIRNIGSPFSPARQVYSGHLTCVPGWNEFVFDQPYYYDGQSNLLVTVYDHSNDYDGNHYINQNFAANLYAEGNGTIYGYSDISDMEFSYETMTSTLYRPVMSFGSSPLLSLPYTDNFDSYPQSDETIKNWYVADTDPSNYRWFLNSLEYMQNWEGAGTMSGSNSLQARPNLLSSGDYATPVSTAIRSPWFDMPTNTDVTISFWMANPATATGNYTKLNIYSEVTAVNYATNPVVLLTELEPQTMSQADGWRQVTFTIPYSYFPNNGYPVRFVFEAEPEIRASGFVNGLMLDDLSITTSRYVSSQSGSSEPFVFDITYTNPYTESFEGVASPADCGWHEGQGFDSDVHWNLVSRPSQSYCPVQSAYEGTKFMHLYYPTQGHAYRWIFSPSLRIVDYQPTDSVIVEFMYANPIWGQDQDSCKVFLKRCSLVDQFRHTWEITASHPQWTKYRGAVSAASLGDGVFDLDFEGIPHYGYGVFIDDVKIYLQRQFTITTNSVPANAGTVTPGGTFGEGHIHSVHATPTEGYEFRFWTVVFDNTDVIYYSDSPDFDILVDGNAVWTATFAPATIHEFDTIREHHEICPQSYMNVFPNSLSYGRVSASASYSELRVGSTVEIMAIPNEGYTFHHWSDGSTQNPRSIVVPSERLSLMAIFIPVVDRPLSVPATSLDDARPRDWTMVEIRTDYGSDPYGFGINSNYSYYVLSSNNYGLIASPRVDAQVSNLRLLASIDCSRYTRVEVGVMTDLVNPATFTPIASFCPDADGVERYLDQSIEVDFSSYAGNGQYIAFRLTNINGGAESSSFWINNYYILQR